MTDNLKWAVVHIETDKETGFECQVSRLDHVRPKYSISFGRTVPPKEGKPGYFSTHIAVRFNNGQQPWNITFLQDYAAAISRLASRAQEWVANDAAARYLDVKVEEEERVLNFNKPKTRVTGKTAKKKERLARARVLG